MGKRRKAVAPDDFVGEPRAEAQFIKDFVVMRGKKAAIGFSLTCYYKDSAVFLNASTMLLATGFFDLLSSTSAIFPFILDFIEA